MIQGRKQTNWGSAETSMFSQTALVLINCVQNSDNLIRFLKKENPVASVGCR